MKIKCCKTNLLAVQDTMDILKGRWKVQIIAALCYDKMRFSDLQKEIEGISAKMLSSELKDLEINQLMSTCCDSGQCSKENCMRLRKQTSNLYLDGCSSKIVFEDYL